MDCEQALILISAALDGEVTEAERAALAQHLEECPQCRALAEDFGVFSVALSDMSAAAPDDLIARVNAALDAEEAPAAASAPAVSRHRRAWGSLAAMFAVVLCLGGVFALSDSLFSGGGSSAALQSAPRASAAMDTAGAEAEPAEAPQMEAATETGRTESVHFSLSGSGSSDGAAQNGAESKESALNDAGAVSNAPAGAAPEPAIETTAVPTPAIETDLTPMDGLMQVYGLLGGTESWPQAEFDSEAVDSVLEITTKEDVTFTTSIRYTGLSANGWYYTYQLNTEENDGFICTFSIVNYYALKLDGSELLTAFDGEYSSEELDAFQEQIGR